jgi:uncharacterized protein (DUF2062 family)
MDIDGYIFITRICSTRCSRIEVARHMIQKEDDKSSKHNRTGVGIAVGVAIGVALGAAMDNMGAGIAIGIAIGIVLGASLSRAKGN